MGFEDFMWYLLSEEDKTTRTSIDYWFRVVDLDNNGIITYIFKFKLDLMKCNIFMMNKPIECNI